MFTLANSRRFIYKLIEPEWKASNTRPSHQNEDINRLEEGDPIEASFKKQLQFIRGINE